MLRKYWRSVFGQWENKKFRISSTQQDWYPLLLSARKGVCCLPLAFSRTGSVRLSIWKTEAPEGTNLPCIYFNDALWCFPHPQQGRGKNCSLCKSQILTHKPFFKGNTSLETTCNWPGCDCRRGYSTKQIIFLERSTCHKNIWPATKGKEEKADQKRKEKHRTQ